MRIDLKKSFITGVFVLGPLVLSIAILIWFFEKVDALFSPPSDGGLGVAIPGSAHIPGTGILAGLAIILLVGHFAPNVVGKRVLDALDNLINRIPGYRTIYATIKQLTNAFSPDSTSSFKEVLLVEYPKENSYALGFRTETGEKNGKRLAAGGGRPDTASPGGGLFHPRGGGRGGGGCSQEPVGGLAVPPYWPCWGARPPPCERLTP